ncbi:hypothetical protein DWZ37_09725 [Clostridiaceae bacterium AF31-3BH]|nr:hypothetical protein DWZ37_09725 [Clostridiaceae bacterium AF31-3BH]
MIRDDLIVTAVFLRELNCFDISTLDARIIVQKKIYLTEKLGINLGYDFSWYIHGPYCPQLTEAVYECVPMGTRQFLGYSISTDASDIVNQVNQIEELAELESMRRSQWLELVASLVFWHENATEESAVKNVKQYKPQFTDGQIRKAVELLKENTDLWR